MEVIVVAFLFFIGFLIWLFPIIKIAQSNRTEGGEKVAWLLLIIFIFWFSWIFYLLLAPLKNNKSRLNVRDI